ncbi:DUF2934 domain-containing protein [Gemmata sp.]|uniref:DUF2934 domain-containing protein n=1 Tax=Gemmata sp. TaxID=1914242 RepID=UPI003F72CD12
MSKHHRGPAAVARPAPETAEPNHAPPVESANGADHGTRGGVSLEEAIRVRAYQNWERAGRPEGDGVAFWLEAEGELTGAPTG